MMQNSTEAGYRPISASMARWPAGERGWKGPPRSSPASAVHTHNAYPKCMLGIAA